MSICLLSCLLWLLMFTGARLPMSPAVAQQREDSAVGPKWEYKVVRFEAGPCSSENELALSMNSAGQQGWELVSYERMSSFPRDADGTLLMWLAATDADKTAIPSNLPTPPPVADSYAGTISMKMSQPPPGGCRMIFKRQAPPSAKP
jgi:Domain of unknown function (DUF4177)